jgi:hypothetical protein
MRSIVILYALGMITWAALIYCAIRLWLYWRPKKKKKNEPNIQA